MISKKILSALILFLFFFNMTNSYAYDTSNLDWSKSKKNWCAYNVKTALGLTTSGDAWTYRQYVDKTEDPQVGDVAVVDRYNKMYTSKGKPAWEGGHLAVIMEVTEDKVRLFDSAYNIWVSKSTVTNLKGGYISVDKLKEIGASRISFISTQTQPKMAYSKFKRLDLFKTTAEDYNTPASIGDIKDLIEIGALRAQEKNVKIKEENGLV